MKQYVRIKSGAKTATMANSEFGYFVELRSAESAPGDEWHEVVKQDGKPTPGDGEELAYTYTVREDGTALKTYFLVAKGKSYRSRTFSKLKAVAVLTKAGYWDSCKKFIEDAGLYDLYLAANELDEDNEHFVQGLGKIQAELGLTDEQVESLLAQMTKTTT